MSTAWRSGDPSQLLPPARLDRSESCCTAPVSLHIDAGRSRGRRADCRVARVDRPRPK